MARTKIEPVPRMDAEIARDVRRKLKANLEVPDDRIFVKVEQGFVTLEGTVAREPEKNAAEACVKAVDGVQGVANRIALAPSESMIGT